MKKKTCFVICPLDKPASRIRHRADDVWEQIIKPAVLPLGYEVCRADDIFDHPIISDAIASHIYQDDLVIADLTGCNPNVFYELGKRHAWGGRCVHLIGDIRQLPFDIKHFRVIEYDLSNAAGLDEVRSSLRKAIKALESTPEQCPFPLTPEKLIRLSGATVVVKRIEGRRDHYYLADQLANIKCSRIFLMQRSSSLILGPELGWDAEKIFYHSLMNQIDKGAVLFHIISLEGIEWHLERLQSTFTQTKEALDRLVDVNGNVGIKSPGPGGILLLKRLPETGQDADLKPDRQARTFIIDTEDGQTEGVLVVDIGGKQSCFQIKGPGMREFFDSCKRFYDECPLLKWSDLRRIPHLAKCIPANNN